MWLFHSRNQVFQAIVAQRSSKALWSTYAPKVHRTWDPITWRLNISVQHASARRYIQRILMVPEPASISEDILHRFWLAAFRALFAYNLPIDLDFRQTKPIKFKAQTGYIYLRVNTALQQTWMNLTRRIQQDMDLPSLVKHLYSSCEARKPHPNIGYYNSWWRAFFRTRGYFYLLFDWCFDPGINQKAKIN